MTRVFDLPNEVLQQIIDVVDPEDIENFAVSRIRISRLAKKALLQHFQRKKEFGTV